MKINYLMTVAFTLTAAVLSVAADRTPVVRHLSGEVGWIDTKLGKLQLKSEPSPNTLDVTEYRINQNETRVTNPTDKKFLTIDDLQPGQRVTIDVIDGKEEKIVQKITADSNVSSGFQEAYGEIQAINLHAGTLSLEGRPKARGSAETNMYFFVFEPQNIAAMQSPSRQPVQVELKPGDVVKVEFTTRNGEQQAHSITLYSPKVTRTMTTTTVTTSR